MWLTELADVLRAANVPVSEETYQRGPWAGRSWKQVGANGRGLTDFRFVMWHHDASPAGPEGSPGALQWCMYGPTAPAASIWVCHGCGGKHASGTWHVYVAGLAWHAGAGGPGWGVAKDAMNSYALGIETDHTFGESWAPDYKQKQLESLRRGTAAIMLAYGLNPSPGLLFHKSWTNGEIDGVPRLATYGRKNDIDGLSITSERENLRGLIRELEYGSKREEIKKLRARILEVQAKRDRLKAFGKLTDEVKVSMRERIRGLRQRIKDITSR